VLRITLNRPKKFNAFSVLQYNEVRDAFKHANDNPSVKVVVLTGNGTYFTAGNDLANTFNPIAELPESATPEEKLAYTLGRVEEFIAEWVRLKKVLIMAINGPAVGVGVTSIPLADFSFAVESATFHTPFMTLAQCPEACSSVTFREVMGPHKAAEFLLLSKKFTAKEAKEAGLVGDVFPTVEAMMQHVNQVAASIASYAPGALLTAKALMRPQERVKYLLDVNHLEINGMRERTKSDEARVAVMNFMSRGKGASKL